MKSFIFCILLFVIGCFANCDCDESDNACISQCVIEANSCVTECKGNIECYESCIDDKWPIQEGQEIPDYYNEMLASTSTSYVTVTTTTTDNLPSATAPTTASMTAKMAENSHTSFASKLHSTITIPSFILFISFLIYFY